MTTVIPSRLDLDSEKLAVGQRRTLSYITPVGQNNNYVPGDRITYEFPNGIHCDLREGYWAFTGVVTPAGTPGSFDCFQWPVSTLIDRIDVYIGTEIIESVTDMSLLRGLMANTWSADLITTNGAIDNLSFEGSYAAATRTTDSALNKIYMVKFGIDSLRQLYPTKFMNNPVKVVIQLAPAARCLYSDGTGSAATYSLSNLRYYYHQVELPDELDNELFSRIQSSRYSKYMHCWEHNQTGQLGSNTSVSLELPFKRRALNKLFVVIRESADVDAITVDNKATLYDDNFDTITEAYVSINGERFPRDGNNILQLDASDEHPTLLRDWVGCVEDISNIKERAYDAVGVQNWSLGTKNSKILCFDLRRDPSRGDLYDNGVATSLAGTSVNLRLTFGTAYTNAIIDAYAVYEQEVQISSRDVRVSN